MAAGRQEPTEPPASNMEMSSLPVQTSAAGTKAASLLGLPQELRDSILDYAVAGRFNLYCRSEDSPSTFRALALTSHQLRREAHAAAARSCTFMFRDFMSFTYFLKDTKIKGNHDAIGSVWIDVSFTSEWNQVGTPVNCMDPAGSANPVARHRRIYAHKKRCELLRASFPRLRSCTIIVPDPLSECNWRGIRKVDSFKVMFERWEWPALLFPVPMVDGGRIRFEHEVVEREFKDGVDEYVCVAEVQAMSSDPESIAAAKKELARMRALA